MQLALQLRGFELTHTRQGQGATGTQALDERLGVVRQVLRAQVCGPLGQCFVKQAVVVQTAQAEQLFVEPIGLGRVQVHLQAFAEIAANRAS